MWKSRFFKNRSGAYIVSIMEVFGVAERVKRDARGGSSGALWNFRAMPKTSDFISIQARERLRQDVKWTCIFRQNTVFIAILAPNGFRNGIWKNVKILKSIWRYWQRLFSDFRWFLLKSESRHMEIPGGALEAEKWLLAGTCSKNNDFRGRPKGAHRGHWEVLAFQQVART